MNLEESVPTCLRLSEAKIRRAVSQDGHSIASILRESSPNWPVEDGLDWSDLMGWVVAELDGAVVAACQCLPSRPVGRIEMLIAHPGIPAKQRFEIIYDLVQDCRAALLSQGVKVATAVVGQDNVKFADILSQTNKGIWLEQGVLFYGRCD